MKISARVHKGHGVHEATVTSGGSSQSIGIPPKAAGFGFDVSGGELLFLALATCYCDNVYREAVPLGIDVQDVVVEALGEFGGPGEPPVNVRYHVRVAADAPEQDIRALILHVDTVAEIQNTLRSGIHVRLGHIEGVSASSSPGFPEPSTL